MSLFATTELPPVPTAPHSRVHHIFYTAPYIKHLFDNFLEDHPESELLERDVTVKALSIIYVSGLKHSSDCWKNENVDDLIVTTETALSRFQHLRLSRGKHMGRHQWDYFLNFFNKLTGERLPSRKSREPLLGTDPESQARFILARLALKLYEMPSTRPKRIAARIERRNKSEP